MDRRPKQADWQVGAIGRITFGLEASRGLERGIAVVAGHERFEAALVQVQ